MDFAWPASGAGPRQGFAGWTGDEQQQGTPGPASAHPSDFSSASPSVAPTAGPSSGRAAYIPVYSSFDIERILAASDQGQGAPPGGGHSAFPAGSRSTASGPSHPAPSRYPAQQPHPPCPSYYYHTQEQPPPAALYSLPPQLPPPPSHPSHSHPSLPNQPAYQQYPHLTSSGSSYSSSPQPQHPPPTQPKSWQKRRLQQYDGRTGSVGFSFAPEPLPIALAHPEWVQQLAQPQQMVSNGLPLPPSTHASVHPPSAADFAPALMPGTIAVNLIPPDAHLYEHSGPRAHQPEYRGYLSDFASELPVPPSTVEPQPQPASSSFASSTSNDISQYPHTRTTTLPSSASIPFRPGSATSLHPGHSSHPPQLSSAPPTQHEAAYKYSHYSQQSTTLPPPNPPPPDPDIHPSRLPPPPATASSSAPHPPALVSSSRPSASSTRSSSRSSTAARRIAPSAAPSRSSSNSLPGPPSTPARANADANFLALASVRRLAHASLPPPLTYKSSRASTATADEGGAFGGANAEQRRKEKDHLERGRVKYNQAGGVGSLDFVVRCAGGGGLCNAMIAEHRWDGQGKGKGRPLARVVLRGLSTAMAEAVEAQDRMSGRAVSAIKARSSAPMGGGAGARCWACVGKKEGQEGVVKAGAPPRTAPPKGGSSSSHKMALPTAAQGGRKRKVKAAEDEFEGTTGRDKGYEDTLSAAIDRLEIIEKGHETARECAAEMSESEAEEEEWEGMLLVEEKKVKEEWKSEAMKCDVCTLTCGLGTFSPSSLVLSASGPPAFTVEIICARCDALFQCCSDCGGGGGRLTPGRWRSKELFPGGRKTCKLSHARNPALGEVTIDVLSLSPTPPSNLSSLENRCREIYFNARLGTIARPEFLLCGDGLARSYEEVYKVTVDHWSLLSALLREQPDESTGVKRYLTLMYSTPRKRHAIRTDKDGDPVRKSSKKSEKVAFGFAISIADFNDATLFFCCVMPWPTSGQAYDAMTVLGESTTARVKSDLKSLSASRLAAGKSPYNPLSYNYVVSPFKLGSKANIGLTKRGYEPLEEVEKTDLNLRREWFPPLKEVWLPKPYSAALQVYIRRLESEDDLGGLPPENAPRKRARKSNIATATAASTPSSTASPASINPLDYSPFASTVSPPQPAGAYDYVGLSSAGLPFALPTPPNPSTLTLPDTTALPPSTFYCPFDPSSPFFDLPPSSYVVPSHHPEP
ncbi:hypothetical protein JCM11251_002278 [Rhodosporidiobolus azoricus]